MNTNTELIRSHVDTIIMRTLENQDRYGYEILDIIASLSDKKYVIKQPTLYSCLKRLEKQGFISSYAGVETNGAQRKYYKLEEKGKDTLIQDKSEWEFSRSIIDKLLSDKKIDLKEVDPPFDTSTLRPLTKRIKAYDVFANENNEESDSNFYYENIDNDDENGITAEYENDSVSIELFNLCKNKLKETEEKIKELEKLVENNIQSNDNINTNRLELENIELRDNIKKLETELALATFAYANTNHNNISETLALQNDEEMDYMRQQLENIQTEYGQLNKRLIEKISENNTLKVEIERLNEERHLFSSQKLFSKEPLLEDSEIKTEFKNNFNKDVLNNLQREEETHIENLNVNAKEDIDEDFEAVNNAKKLLAIGEYSKLYTPEIGDNFKIKYKEQIVASIEDEKVNKMETTFGFNYSEQTENNEEKYFHNHSKNMIKEKTVDVVNNNKASENISNGSLINLKNDMIKNGYKIKTYTKDLTEEYYRNNYVYFNKMLIFISLSLFLINIIEILVFGLTKETFKVNDNFLIIIFAISASITGILILISFQGVKIIKKNQNYLKSIMNKITIYVAFVTVTMIIFAFNASLKQYFLKAPMFVPIILLLNIPLYEIFKLIAEKSNKYNVSY